MEQFYKSPGMRDGHRNDCKACNLAAKNARYRANPEPYLRRTREWRAANPERYAANRLRQKDSGQKAATDRRGHLRRTFNLTEDEYWAKVAAQGGTCAICGRAPKEGVHLDVDHDHTTQAVRGLLCRNCNHGLGKFGDDPAVLAAALLYLHHWAGPGRRQGEWAG